MSTVAPDLIARDKTLSQQLAEFVASLVLEDIPGSVQVRAKHLLLDALGIAFASNEFEFADKSAAGIGALAGSGDHTVFGRAERLPLRDAVLLNGILVHGLDYDDTHVPGVIHATASLAPTVLGLGERLGASGAAVLAAYIAGLEAATRIAASAQGGFHKVGFHPTGLVGAFGCALAAAKLLGLDSQQMTMAQGIALSMAGGSMEFLEEGAWTKRMHPGWAGTCGITAAYLAAGGFTGPSTSYEGRFGLFNTHLDPRDPPIDQGEVVAGLGERWEIERVAVKPFPACHFVHASADAALALVRDHGLEPAQVERVTALMPAPTIPTVCEPVANKIRPVSDYDAKFSVQFTVAASIVRGKFGLAELEDDARTDPTILDLAKRVDYAPDPESTFPAAYSGEVQVRTTDGRILRHREAVNRGAEQRPLSNREIALKYEENARLALGTSERVERVRQTLLALESAPNLDRLMEALHG